MRQLALVLLVTGAMGGASLDGSILRRHDRSDDEYRALAARYEGLTCDVGGAVGTRIGDRWLLTAAHVVANVSPFSRSAYCGDRPIAIEAMYSYPGFELQRDANGDAVDSRIADMALVRLETPVTGPVARIGRTRDEPGQAIVVLGRGLTGTGETGPEVEDGVLRAATNVVDDTSGMYLAFSFSPPDDSSATDLEGIGGPGDSGGPALVERDGELVVIGVSSLNHQGDAAGPSRYRSIEVYARTSTAAGWIDAVMTGTVAPDAPRWRVTRVEEEGFPATDGGRLAQAWLAAFNAQDSAIIVDFERRHRAESVLAANPAEARVAGWRRLAAQWGTLRATGFTEAEDVVQLKLTRSIDGLWFRLEFVLEPGTNRVLRMLMHTPEDPEG